MPGNGTPGGASLQKHGADGKALLAIRQRQWDFVVLQDGPDGSYPERPNYWSYGTTFHVRVVEALRSARGSSFDLKKAPGFLQSAGFMEQVVAPGGEDFSFSGHHERPKSEPVLLWFARELGRRSAARQERNNLTPRILESWSQPHPDSPAARPWHDGAFAGHGDSRR